MPFFPKTCVALGLAGIVVVACSDLGTESFDPMGSSKKAQEAFSRVGSNPAVHNFSALQSAFTFTAPPQASQPTAAATAPAAPAGVPAGALGKTFIYDSPTAKYVSSDQTGAPANGARFILYEVNPTTRAISIPLVPIGYLDLTNEASGLGVKAVIGTATVVDYGATGTSLDVSAKGYAADGTGRLDFELVWNFSVATGDIRLDYKVSTSSPDITIQTVATHEGATRRISTTLTVTENRNKLEVTATGTTTGPVTGTVEYNRHDIATITGTSQAPVFTGQGGRQLTAAEIDGLKQLFDFVDVLFEGIDDLLVPAQFAL